MKKYSLNFFSCCLLLLMISCGKNDSMDSPLDGKYVGQLMSTAASYFNGEENLRSDTLSILLEIDNNRFKRFNENNQKICSGEIEMEDEQLVFTTDNCDCLCDCSPFVDCAGDVILGQYQYEIEDDVLRMWVSEERTDTINLAQLGPVVMGWFHEERYTLKKN